MANVRFANLVNKCYKDSSEQTLDMCGTGIAPNELNGAAHASQWSRCHDAIDSFEATRVGVTQSTRQTQKPPQSALQDSELCNGASESRVGRHVHSL